MNLRGRRRRAVGIDLAGSPARATGYSMMTHTGTITAAILSDDQSIRKAVARDRPDLVVIDAPLSLPIGRATMEDRTGPHFRECDRELRKLGIRFFPLTLGPMRMLTIRGMGLRSALENDGFRVIEGYPGGSQDRLGIPRKGAGTSKLQRALLGRGLAGVLRRRSLSHDELDAVTIAWTGYQYLNGHGIVIGDPAEGLMLLPEYRVAADLSGVPPGRGHRNHR
ncbi:MAG: DUF429 domain-containing protein [Thermoplasmata archaeon]|nr:DUF429 domain-containing protein [Thermoplasmata archaeon]